MSEAHDGHGRHLKLHVDEMLVGDEPYLLSGGAAHFLMFDEHGTRHRLGTAPKGTVALVRGGPPVIAVMREGTTLSHVDDAVDPVALESGLANWRRLVSRAMTDSADARLVEECVVSELPACAGATLARELARRVDRGRTALAGSKSADDEVVARTLERNAATVRDPLAQQLDPDRSILYAVMKRIGSEQGFTAGDPRDSGATGERAAQAAAGAAGVRYRAVRLRAGWNHFPSAPMLGFLSGTAATEHAMPVALIPRGESYRLYQPGVSRKLRRVTPEVAERLDPIAYTFTVPLPRDKEIRYRDLAKLGFRQTGRHWLIVGLASLAVSVLALASPALTQVIMSKIVPLGQSGLLVAIGVGLFMVALVSAAFSVVQSLTVSAISQQSELRVQAAVWDRTLAMPPNFFRRFSSGDLMGRVLAASESAQIVSSATVSQVLGAAFSLVSFVLLLQYSLALSILTAIVLIISVAAIAIVARQMRHMVRGAVSSQRIATSWMVQLLTGISKIRVAGAETRLVAQHQERIRGIVDYSAQQTLVTNRMRSFFVAMTGLVPAAAFIVIYRFDWSASGPEITGPTFMAFLAAFGTVYGAVSSLSYVVLPLMTASSTLGIARPILQGTPEPRGTRTRITRSSGSFELINVSFRYGSGMPLALKDVSLKIEPGEFVAVVGPSGSGKSTLVRLLLGFEHPTEGQVLLNGMNVADIDLQDMRSQLGVVLQNGTLMQASILDNILAGMPLPEDVAWQAADAAALGDDIRAMPMKMHTRIDTATVSGGQAQRIMLARALVRKPPILILDEATSAVDNDSQAVMTQSLESLGSTRIVVAHRLSTIRRAHRIIVVAGGKIVEQGSFDELLAAGGTFTALARRQMVSDRENSEL